MNKNMRSCNKVLALLAAATAFCVTTQAGIVYDNSTTPLGSFLQTTNEFGDQVKLAGNPLERDITTIKFEYYLSHNASGDEKADLRLYANNGLSGTPGSLLYDSGAFSIVSGYRNVVVDGLTLFGVQPDVTWTVEFSGVQTGEAAGLLFYNPPTTGSSFDDYWVKEGGSWVAKRLSPSGGPIANFGAQILAVPEPTTVQLGLLAGLALLGRMAYRRRQA